VTNDPTYDVALSLALVHLQEAADAFRDDPALPWKALPGQVPRERQRVWVDALKRTLAEAERIERQLP
jgi:hypothetical protein